LNNILILSDKNIFKQSSLLEKKRYKKSEMSWLEVETKVRIDRDNVHNLREKIKKIARFVKKEKRGDDYFALRRFRKRAYPKKAFRIRSTKNKNTANFKKWLRRYWSKDIIVKQEFEFNIENPEHFLALMRNLGFRQWIKKIKGSEGYLHKKDKRIIIEINKVKHLGHFMEIEYLCRESEMQKAKEKIRQVLKELGIKQKQIDNTGYTKMLWKRGIRDKRYFID